MQENNLARCSSRLTLPLARALTWSGADLSSEYYTKDERGLCVSGGTISVEQDPCWTHA